jgi:ribosomal protein S21
MPAIIQGCPCVVAPGLVEFPSGREHCLRGGDCKDMRVELRDGEGFDQLFRRFTKGIERSGVIREHRRGLRFISVQEENRAKRRKAERRRRRNATT